MDEFFYKLYTQLHWFITELMGLETILPLVVLYLQIDLGFSRLDSFNQCSSYLELLVFTNSLIILLSSLESSFCLQYNSQQQQRDHFDLFVVMNFTAASWLVELHWALYICGSTSNLWWLCLCLRNSGGYVELLRAFSSLGNLTPLAYTELSLWIPQRSNKFGLLRAVSVHTLSNRAFSVLSELLRALSLSICAFIVP